MTSVSPLVKPFFVLYRQCELLPLRGGFHSYPQTDRLRYGDERRQPRVSTLRQRSVQTLALNTSGLGDLGDSLRLG